MVVDHNYKISVFGDFSDINPTSDNMLFFLEAFRDYGLIPSIFQELRIDQGNPQSAALQRIALISGDNSEHVIIATNRIDFEIAAIDDKKLSGEQLDLINKKIMRIFQIIFDKFQKKASRLALNAESLIVNLSKEEIADFMRLYSNPISLYNENMMGEWSTRLMTRKSEVIGSNEETFNIITSLSKTTLKKHRDNQVTESIDGFSVNVDINTLAENTVQRFSEKEINDFISHTNLLWNKIIEEMG